MIRGRVSSLLEVGTGFHPELTGRENVYMNGTILGMTKREIDRKFDEIIDFSGVEKFLDTPTKRYSSGMKVRLAFAVAAHLEPEILVIDEVLAVGDAEFQRKCLGKMQDVARKGRTVLFVSHNLAAIQSFCNVGVLLSSGQVAANGGIGSVTDHYLQSTTTSSNPASLEDARESGCDKTVTIQQVDIDTSRRAGISELQVGEDFAIRLKLSPPQSHFDDNLEILVAIYDRQERPIAFLKNMRKQLNYSTLPGSKDFIFAVKNCQLSPGNYVLNVRIRLNSTVCDWIKNVSPFTVVEGDFYGVGKLPFFRNGSIFLQYEETLI